MLSRNVLNCTKLASGPDIIVANTNGCCSYMFKDCTALTFTPILKAMELGPSCYLGMFQGCTNLTRVQPLPATQLANACYSYMFDTCSSLITGPTLPATELIQDSYSYMFNNCTKLNSVKIYYTGNFVTTEGSSSYNWLLNVASSGTLFYKGQDKTESPSAIPTGWTPSSEWIS